MTELLEVTETDMQSIISEDKNNYNILVYNNDYTSAEFVVSLFLIVFKMPVKMAISKTEEIHNSGPHGAGVIGPYCRAEAYALLDDAEAFKQRCGEQGLEIRVVKKQ